MMAAGLILTTLYPIGVNRYGSNRAIFDLSRILDPTLRLQVAQALDLGFQCRTRSATMSSTCRLLVEGRSHGVSFFDNAVEALSGTHQSEDFAGVGGFSTWCYNSYWGMGSAPIGDREKLRVWLNPTGGYFSVTGRGFEYNRLVNVLWHELHHCTTTQHHIRSAAPYDKGDPWIAAIAEIAQAFPDKVRDPVTGKQIALLSKDMWTKNSIPAQGVG